MQVEITHMQQVFLYGERNMLKTTIISCINQTNRDALQFIFSTELTLQVHNLSLYSLKAFDPNLVKILLVLSSYFLVLFL